MDYILTVDTELFFLLNGLHTSWLDPVMYYASKTAVWIPLYAFLFYLIIKKFGMKSWTTIVCIIVCIVCTDQSTSTFMKPYFERLRPTHEPEIQAMVHTVKGYTGGKYGFASSHAANTFGIAMFLYILLCASYRWMGLLFCWAIFVSYTRIYLGVHYPGDIVAGMIVGLFFGWLVYRLNSYLDQKFVRS